MAERRAAIHKCFTKTIANQELLYLKHPFSMGFFEQQVLVRNKSIEVSNPCAVSSMLC